MEDYERTALKAACIQAAAILVAPRAPSGSQPATPPFVGRAGSNTAMEPDTGACARYARDLFGKLTGEPWD